ncbi:MAG: TIGR00645 family protein [Cytophagales bacterium]
MAKPSIIKSGENFIESIIFASRWLQMPVYLGLIVGTGLYVYKFFEELIHLANEVNHFTDVDVMLSILGLIDISMVMNLLIIVIIGGYSIFTSRIDFTEHEDRPHWLDHMDAGILKIKLATSLASISGVHLLRTFIDIHNEAAKDANFNGVIIEIVIHLVFIISALMLAWVERILHESHFAAHRLEKEKHDDNLGGGAIPHSEIAH